MLGDKYIVIYTKPSANDILQLKQCNVNLSKQSIMKQSKQINNKKSKQSNIIMSNPSNMKVKTN